MKAKQLATLLDQISTILKQLPDMELSTALSVISQNLYLQHHTYPTTLPQEHVASPVQTTPNTRNNTSNYEVAGEDSLISELEKTPTEELNEFFRSTKVWKKDLLQKVASHYGISFTTKTTKDVLLNLIITQIETQRGHSRIRSYQVEHPQL